MGRRFSVSSLLEKGWQFFTTLAIIAGCVGLLLFTRLDSLLPGYSELEINSARESKTIGQIVNNPINAPFKFVAFGYGKVTGDQLLATRLAAATFGVATLALFYIGVRHWYRRRIAFLATVLFGCSAWFLHLARIGTPDILFPYSILLLAVCGYWLAMVRHSALSSIAAILALALCIYVPGILWLLIPAIIIRRKDVARILIADLNWLQRFALLLLALLIVVAPLAWSISKDTSIIASMLGLPVTMPSALAVLQNLASVPAQIFIWSGGRPEFTLGNLPYVDIFTSIMCVLGVYYYFRYRPSLDRTKLLAMFIVVACVLVALDGGVHIAILMPSVYIVATAGIAALWRQWLTVFPKNPIAKTVGISLITLAVLASCAYNLRAYYVAWAYNSDTRASFRLTEEDLIQ